MLSRYYLFGDRAVRRASEGDVDATLRRHTHIYRVAAAAFQLNWGQRRFGDMPRTAGTEASGYADYSRKM